MSAHQASMKTQRELETLDCALNGIVHSAFVTLQAELSTLAYLLGNPIIGDQFRASTIRNAAHTATTLGRVFSHAKVRQAAPLVSILEEVGRALDRAGHANESGADALRHINDALDKIIKAREEA